MYLTLSDKGEKTSHLKPEILRALTELFLVVENIALDWRTEQDLLVETITEDSLSQLLEKVHVRIIVCRKLLVSHGYDRVLIIHCCNYCLIQWNL